MRFTIISNLLFADKDTGICPNAATKYHALSVDKQRYPYQRGNEFIFYAMPKRFNWFKMLRSC